MTADPVASVVLAGHVAQHSGRDVRRLLLDNYLRNGRRLDAALFVEGTRLVLGRIRNLLHLVGTDRISGIAHLRLDLRPLRPPARLLCHARGRRDLSHAVGLCHDRHRTLGLRTVMADICFLGFWGPSTILTAEIYPTRSIRGAGNGFHLDPSLAWLVGFIALQPFVMTALDRERTGSFCRVLSDRARRHAARMGAGILWLFTRGSRGKKTWIPSRFPTLDSAA